jgi:hypothetical protein
MRRVLAGLLAVLLSPVHPAFAADHLVSGVDVNSALLAAVDARMRDLGRLDRVLAAPEAAAAAAALGASPAGLRRALSTLSDAELRDLAVRAAALEADPAAGSLDPTIRQLLIIFLIVAIVILVFQAVD